MASHARKPKQLNSKVLKILNLTVRSPTRIENSYFTLDRLITDHEARDKAYRSSTQRITTIKGIAGSPATVEKRVFAPQEGCYLHTHTLILKENAVDKSSRLLIKAGFAEDVCLLLSLFSGVGVYTEQSALRYSHKARLPWGLYSFEFQDAVSKVIERIDDADAGEVSVLGLALSKYRECMQPMSHNNSLVRLWEIVDILGDFYCKDRNKPIPKGYDETGLRKEIGQELRKIERKTGIPLIKENGFTPILIQKSIRQKISDLINKKLQLATFLGVDENKLNAVIKNAYTFRGKLTHSSGADFSKKEDIDDLVRYHMFVSQLTFVMLLILLDTNPEQTFLELREDLRGFTADKKYYHKKSDMIEKKSEEFEEVAKYLTGEKPIPPGKTTFKL